MRIWTYEEARRKVQKDLDLEEELFVTPSEMLGYFNEAIDEAEAIIMKINEDYFLTEAPILLVAGRAVYSPPDNIYAMKIRKLRYQNGSIYYDVKRMRDHRKFGDIADFDFASSGTDDFMYYIRNDSANGFKIVLSRKPEESSGAQVSISLGTPGTFTTVAAHGLAIGDEVYLWTSDELPTGFVDGGIYTVTAIPTSTTFELSDTPEGSSLAATGTQAGTHKFEKIPFRMSLWYIRNAKRVVEDSDPIDIPEFVSFVLQHVKVRVYEKEGHPNFEQATAELERQRQLMAETLTQMVPDDNDTIPMDTSHYEEHL